MPDTLPGCEYSMVNKTLIHDLMRFTIQMGTRDKD